MNILDIDQSKTLNSSEYSSAVAGFTGLICLNMKDFKTLDECVNNDANLVDISRLYAYKIFLFQMQLMFVKNLTIRHYKTFSPANFSNPDNRSVFGAQYLDEIDFAMAQPVLTYKRSQTLQFSTPFKFSQLCFYVRRPGLQKTKANSK